MAKRAAVAVHPSNEAVLLAQFQDKQVTTKEDVYDATDSTRDNPEDRGSITHTGADKVIVYKPSPAGWRPIVLPATNLAVALQNGMRQTCGDCGGFCDVDPNSCPGKPPRLLRRCPICAKKVYDYQTQEMAPVAEDASTAFVIKDEAFSQSTPEQRTRTLLNRHMLFYHATEAETMGIRPLVEKV